VLKELLRVARGRGQGAEEIKSDSEIDGENSTGNESKETNEEESDDDSNEDVMEYDSVGNVINRDDDGDGDANDENGNDEDDIDESEVDGGKNEDGDGDVNGESGVDGDGGYTNDEGVFIFKPPTTTPVQFRKYDENEIASEVEDAHKVLTTDGSNENTLCAGDIISYFHPVLSTWIPGNFILSISEEHDTIGVSGGVGIILKDTQIRLHAKYNKKFHKYVQISMKQNLRAVETYDVDPSMNGKIPIENGRADAMNWILKQMDEAWKKPLPECAEAVEGLLNMLKEKHPGLKDLGEEKSEENK
jgi:hypothetical protein